MHNRDVGKNAFKNGNRRKRKITRLPNKVCASANVRFLMRLVLTGKWTTWWPLLDVIQPGLSIELKSSEIFYLFFISFYLFLSLISFYQYHHRMEIRHTHTHNQIHFLLFLLPKFRVDLIRDTWFPLLFSWQKPMIQHSWLSTPSHQSRVSFLQTIFIDVNMRFSFRRR